MRNKTARKADEGLISLIKRKSKAWEVTTSDFTAEGKDEARITNVTLINGS